MALEINNATNAISEKGINNLKNTLVQNVGRITYYMNYGPYTDFLQVINNNWSGTSKENFIKDLKNKKYDVSSDLHALMKRIENDLNDLKNNFKKLDATAYHDR